MNPSLPLPSQTSDPLDSIQESKASKDASILKKSTDSQNLAEQELQYKFKDGERGEKYRIHIHRIVVAGMYVIGFVMISLIAIRAWHFAAPEKLKWLNDNQNHEIERIIFSGLILSLASKYFKKFNIFDDKS